MTAIRRQPNEIIYPEEDGKVSESDKHYKQAMHLITALDVFFATRTDVFVGGNLFVYYQEGEPRKNFSPDVLVAFGVLPRPSEERGSYKVWEEGVIPQVIVELTSASTRQVDTIRKRHLYARLGVREYYLFDPLGEFLTPRLQGYHLNSASRYEAVSGEELESPLLGLRLVMRDGWLRLLDSATDHLLPTAEEQQATITTTEAALAAAEAEIARLRAELVQRQENT